MYSMDLQTDEIKMCFRRSDNNVYRTEVAIVKVMCTLHNLLCVCTPVYFLRICLRNFKIISNLYCKNYKNNSKKVSESLLLNLNSVDTRLSLSSLWVKQTKVNVYKNYSNKGFEAFSSQAVHINKRG